MSNYDPTPDLPSSLPPVVMSLLRFVGGIVAGWLLSKGWFTTEQIAQLGGGAIAVVGAAWVAYSSWAKNQALKKAIIAPAGEAK